jgi:hypothetical protein
MGRLDFDFLPMGTLEEARIHEIVKMVGIKLIYNPETAS